MTTSTKRLLQGFTLIELLTVIAIIGILAAIIIPTVGKVRETTQRTVAGNSLRQIGQASLIYATDNKDKLPTAGSKGNLDPITATGGSLYGVAFQLALSGGLNEPNVWFASPDVPSQTQSQILNNTRDGLEGNFTQPNYTSYSYVVGLKASDGSTAPIAFTRGLQDDGTWKADPTTDQGSTWNGDGGHIVFVGGNVSWYKDIKGSNRLPSRDGSLTEDLMNVLPRQPDAARGIGFFRAHQPTTATVLTEL